MPPFNLERLTYVWPLTQPAAFWRAHVTRELGGFDESLKYIGDWDFFIRAGRRFTVVKIDEFLAISVATRHRRHSARQRPCSSRRGGCWIATRSRPAAH